MKTLSLAEGQKKVFQWSALRGIHEQSTLGKQVEYFCGERGELASAETVEQQMDAFGDQMVCLFNCIEMYDQGKEYPECFKGFSNPSEVEALISYSCFIDALNLIVEECESAPYNFDPEECLAMAYAEIAKRAGLMVDGVFKKWANLTHELRIECARTGQLMIEGIDLEACEACCSTAEWAEIEMYMNG